MIFSFRKSLLHTITISALLNNKCAVDSFYDRYAPILLGVISRLTDNASIAEAIFIKTYTGLTKVDGYKNYPLAFLLKYFHNHASDYLRKNKIIAKKTDPQQTGLVYLLATSYYSTREASLLLNVPVSEVGGKIRKEFTLLKKSF